MDLVEGVLVGATLPVIVACIVWFVRFNTSQQKGERLILKAQDMDLVRKTVAGLILVWVCLNLYLTTGDLLAFLNVVVLPLGSTYSIYRPILFLASASTMVGLVLFFSIRFPKRSVVA